MRHLAGDIFVLFYGNFMRVMTEHVQRLPFVKPPRLQKEQFRVRFQLPFGKPPRQNADFVGILPHLHGRGNASHFKNWKRRKGTPPIREADAPPSPLATSEKRLPKGKASPAESGRGKVRAPSNGASRTAFSGQRLARPQCGLRSLFLFLIHSLGLIYFNKVSDDKFEVLDGRQRIAGKGMNTVCLSMHFHQTKNTLEFIMRNDVDVKRLKNCKGGKGGQKGGILFVDIIFLHC
jgi:hypothetical protein